MPRQSSLSNPLLQPMFTGSELVLPFLIPDVPVMEYDEALPGSSITESVIHSAHPHNRCRIKEVTQSYTYRQRIPKLNFTLGWELEANHTPLRIPAGIENTGDRSVNGDGAEFVVLPAITKSPRYVLGLLKDLVHAPRLNTDKSCGFHVHVSASNISSLARMRQWAIATEYLALQIEDLAFNAVPASRQSNSYCKRISPLTHGTSFEAKKYNNNRRYHWLNTVEMFRPNGIRTIENRLLGHTHRWKYVLAWTLFTMELCRRGWELSRQPFEIKEHVSMLSDLLMNIEKQIKPLSKRSEPIPEWVYEGLSTFSIEKNAWDRPLASLAESEATINGIVRPSYRDDQTEIPNEEDEDSCPCECGEEGYCASYLHSQDQCHRNWCEYCHADRECSGLPDCDFCIERAHDNEENCNRAVCSTCNVRRRSPRAITGRTMPLP